MLKTSVEFYKLRVSVIKRPPISLWMRVQLIISTHQVRSSVRIEEVISGIFRKSLCFRSLWHIYMSTLFTYKRGVGPRNINNTMNRKSVY